MNPENSLLVPYKARPLRGGEYFQGDGQWWAEPDHAGAVEAMRLAASGSAQVKRLGERAREHIRTYYSYQERGRVALSALRGTLAAVHPS